jgi:hypothetical protein
MSDQSDDLERLRGSLGRLASEARRRQGAAHPSAEDLVAYGAGELKPAAAEAILEHLAVCPPCTRLVLSLPAFSEAQEPEQAAFDPETDAAWQALAARLQAGPTVPAAPEERTAERPPRILIPPPRPATLALAACLAVCVIGFSAWILTHGRSRVPPPIVPINPPERTLGETPPPGVPPPALRLDAEAAALVLYLRAPQTYPRLRVEILNRDGKISSPAAAAPIDPQEVLVLLTREQLPPGDYRLRVVGLDANRQQALGDYPLRILGR